MRTHWPASTEAAREDRRLSVVRPFIPCPGSGTWAPAGTGNALDGAGFLRTGLYGNRFWGYSPECVRECLINVAFNYLQS